MRWTFPDGHTAVLHMPKSPSCDQDSQTPDDHTNSNQETVPQQYRGLCGDPSTAGTFAEKFRYAIGELLEECVERVRGSPVGFNVGLQHLGSVTKSDAEEITQSLVCLLTQPHVDKVSVPGSMYRVVYGKCRAALIEEAVKSLGLPGEVSVWGTTVEAKDIIDVGRFINKLEAEDVSQDTQTTIQTLNKLSQENVLSGEVCPALTSAVMSAHKHLKKRVRSKHKEKKKYEKYLRYKPSVESTSGSQSASSKKEDVTSKDASPGIYQTNYPKCYICKHKFDRYQQPEAGGSEDEHVYNRLCPPCALLNNQKRKQTADLKGRYAVLTGGRLKIGYELAVMMLRDGATVIVTTRFPNDAAKRFAEMDGFEDWKSRLFIYQLDLRDITGK